jgi:hypothetical protein
VCNNVPFVPIFFFFPLCHVAVFISGVRCSLNVLFIN